MSSTHDTEIQNCLQMAQLPVQQPSRIELTEAQSGTIGLTAASTSETRHGPVRQGFGTRLRTTVAGAQSSSSGHGEDSSSTSAEDTILGHGTMASLLNPSFSPQSIAEKRDRDRQALSALFSVSPSTLCTPLKSSNALQGAAEESDSSPSLDSTRQSLDSLTSASSKLTPQSLLSSPSTSPFFAKKRSDSRASMVSSLSRPFSPRGPPPNEPLPSLPNGLNQAARRSTASFASSSRSAGSQGSRNTPRRAPPKEPLPELPNAYTSPIRPSFSSRNGSLAERADDQSRSCSCASSAAAAARRLIGSRGSSLPSPTIASNKFRGNWPGDSSGAGETQSEGVSHCGDSTHDLSDQFTRSQRRALSTHAHDAECIPDYLQPIDPVQRPARSSHAPDKLSQVSMIDPQILSSQSHESTRGQAGRDGGGERNSNASFVALHERHIEDREDRHKPSLNSNAEVDTSKQRALLSTPMMQSLPHESPLLNTPTISIDQADSDSASSHEGPGRDAPRKKRRQKLKANHAYGFDYQRVVPPSLRSSSANSATLSPTVTPAQRSQTTSDPFSFYSFSPELPPFVPQGLRPIDLTGRGTWQSIAARAGGISPVLSRANSISAAQDLVPEGHNEVNRTSGPVSMRQIAAEARAKQKFAIEFAERQGNMLSQKSWQPADIHALAAEHNSQCSPTLRESAYGGSQSSFMTPQITGSHASLRSFATSHDSTGLAYNFSPVSYLHRASSFASHVSQHSEAGVGDSSVHLFGLGITEAPDQPPKQYREFAQQTTPPASPEPEPEPEPEAYLSGSKEVGVGNEKDVSAQFTEHHLAAAGGVGSDSRVSRREFAAVAGLDAWTSAGEDEDDEAQFKVGRVRPPPRTRPEYRKSVSERSHTAGSVDDSLSPFKIYTPRLSSRRSNIGTSTRKNTHTRKSTLSLAEDNSDSTVAANAQSAVDSHSSDEDSEDSEESDIDLATPAGELAARTGAFDAIVQARGAKRKLKQMPLFNGQLIAPGTHRAIAGSLRVHSSVVLKAPQTPRCARGTSKDVDDLAKEVKAAAISLSPPKRASFRSTVSSSSPYGKRTTKDAPIRSESPDLEQSFAADRHGDSDDEDESLMLSEMEFPQPSASRYSQSTRPVLGRPKSQSMPNYETIEVDVSLPLGSHADTDNMVPHLKTANTSVDASAVGSMASIATPSLSDVNDTPNTNIGSEAWPTVGDSHRESVVTVVTEWSRGSAELSDNEEAAKPDMEDVSKSDPSTAPGAVEHTHPPSTGHKDIRNDMPSFTFAATAQSEQSDDAARPSASAIPSPRVSFAGVSATPVNQRPLPRSSLPAPSSRPGILKTLTPIRRPSEPLPCNAVAATGRTPSTPTLRSGIRPPQKAPLASAVRAPTLRKAASFACRPTFFEVPSSTLSGSGAISPPLSQFSAASPSMAVPSDFSRISRSPSRSSPAPPSAATTRLSANLTTSRLPVRPSYRQIRPNYSTVLKNKPSGLTPPSKATEASSRSAIRPPSAFPVSARSR